MGLNDIGKVKETTDVTLTWPGSKPELGIIEGETVYNEDGSPMTITIHGPHSSTFKSVSHAQQNKRLMKAQRTGGKLNLTAEEMEASSLDLLVKCTEDWNITLDKKPEEFSHERVRQVYQEHPWVREQVDAVFGDTRAFLD